MKKDTKHNLLETCMYILLGLIVVTIYAFIEGISRSTLLLIILCPIVFCIAIVLLIFVFRARPYKNRKKRKNLFLTKIQQITNHNHNRLKRRL